MSVKSVMAIVVAALVAGVVLGSFGIANAGSGQNATVAPGAMAPAPAGMMSDCGSCEQEAASECGDGSCPDMAAPADAAAAPANPAAAQQCPGTGAGAAAGGECGSGECGVVAPQ